MRKHSYRLLNTYYVLGMAPIRSTARTPDLTSQDLYQVVTTQCPVAPRSTPKLRDVPRVTQLANSIAR